MDRFELEYNIMSLLSTVCALELVAEQTDGDVKIMIEGVAKLLELKHDKIMDGFTKLCVQ
jgi:hypothetical protein